MMINLQKTNEHHQLYIHLDNVILLVMKYSACKREALRLESQENQ